MVYDAIAQAVACYTRQVYDSRLALAFDIYSYYEVGDYVLIVCEEPDWYDLGADLVYQWSTQTIIGYFEAGYRG